MEFRETKKLGGWQVELVDGSTTLSWCSIVNRQMRIGTARVSVGGIGGVGTLREHRRKGYSRRVMERAMEVVEREGYDISFLHGIQNFYHRFGFVTCMPEHSFSLDTRDAERAVGKSHLRRMRDSDLPQIVRLYNRDNNRRTGSAVRRLGTWRGFVIGTWWSRPAGTRVVVDGRDRVLGYVVYDDIDDCCRAAEVGGSGEEVYATILTFLAKRAVALRRERVWADIPADHPFAVYCRDYGLRLNTHYTRNERHMGRIANFTSCVTAVLPELERRWGPGERDQHIGLRTDVGEGTLLWKGDSLVFDPGVASGAVRLSQQKFMQWLMGYVTPLDMVAMRRVAVRVAQRPLVERLFPRQDAQLWWADRF